MNIENLLKTVPKPEIDQKAMRQTILDVQAIAEKNHSKQVSIFKRFHSAMKPFSYMAASFLIGIIMSATLFSSVAYSMPGSFFYPIKLITEKIVYIFNVSPSGKAELKIVFSQQRMNELTQNFNMKGKVDKQVLALLLQDAQDALDISQTLPVAKQSAVKQKIHQMNENKIEALRLMEQKTTGDIQLMIKECRESCERMKH